MDEWRKRRWRKEREARKALGAAILIGTVTKTKEPTETKAKAKVGAKPDIATIAESEDTSEWIDHTSVPTAQMKLQREKQRRTCELGGTQW